MNENPPIHDAEVQELKEVLTSRLFSRSPRLAELLAYLCGKSFNGEAAQIKEFTIAVEHFGRSSEFQSRNDPIVRVDANRLRQRLRRYYRTEGKGHTVQIIIPSGQYAPVFQYRPPSVTGTPANGNGAEPVELVSNDGSGGLSPESAAPPLHTGQRAWKTLVLIPGGVIVLILISLALVKFRAPFQSVTEALTGGDYLANASPQGQEIRILAGSTVEKVVDQNGEVWSSDQYFRGGEVYTPMPTALVRSDDSILCRAVRVGDFRYDIPLKAGIYELHLYFAEMRYGNEPEEGGESTRRFNVLLNGKTVLNEFDMIADVAGPGLLTMKVFKDIRPAEDGLLHLEFKSLANGASLSGIEILPGVPGKMRPVRITTRTNPYISSDSKEWEPDRFFRGGRLTTRGHAVAGTHDSALYQAERFGHFKYVIPVVPGKHKVTLRFAETYFGQKNFGGSAVGFRIFNVHCNGRMLLENFDIAKEAGGDNRALDKVFQGIQSDPQDKIILTFVPVKNYACVNAIEIEEE